ncbi:MAG TPA: ABC transporter ATP-binding protein [bacterium]|nr:ABC transporter ATP-binding protein [bacterium]
MILEIENLHVRYGSIEALKGVSLRMEEGEMVALIGSNGAGKTTLLRTISGILRPSAGSIEYRGPSAGGEAIALHTLAPHKIVSHGIAQVPEGRMVFSNLTVLENLELGAYGRKGASGIKSDLDHVMEIFPRLRERIAQNAGTLSGGEQQMLAVGRALMARPRLLLLDEPSLGIAPALVQQIFKVLVEINRKGTTILLVEQDAYLALKSTARAYVLETGTVKTSGPSAQLMSDPEVKKAYLGG